MPASSRITNLGSYDPMLVSSLAGDTRESPPPGDRGPAQLRDPRIRTNIGLLLELLEHPRFIAGELDRGFSMLRATRSVPADSRHDARRPGDCRRRTGVRLQRGYALSRSSAGVDPWISLRGARV
jgi:hypothetical protein